MYHCPTRNSHDIKNANKSQDMRVAAFSSIGEVFTTSVDEHFSMMDQHSH